MIKRLGDIATYVNGYAFKPSDRGDKGLPIIRIQDLTGNSYDLGYYDGVYPSKIEVNDGDILISWSGSLGIYIWNHGKALLNQHIFKVVFDKEEVNKQYYVFAVQYKLQEMISKTHGATMKHIVKKDFNNILIPVPTLEMQSKMASVLSKINTIISARQKQIKMLDELIKARFVEMFGDLKINEKRWNSKTFEEMSVLITDGEHATPRRTTEGIYLLSARNVLNHSFQLEDVDYIDQEEYDRIARRIVPKKGDVLVSCSGTVGRCCSVPPNFKFQMVRSVALIRFNDEINPLFAEYMIASDYIQEQINRCKTISSQANLFQGKIKMLRGFIPPIELQNEFADFVKQVDKSKLAIQKSLDKLEILKNSLMQKYFG